MREGWKYERIGDLCDILDNKRKPITKKDRVQGEFPYYGATGVLDYINGYLFDEKLVLIGEDGAKWGEGENSAFIAEGKYWVNNHAHVVRPHRHVVTDDWLIFYLNYSNLMPFVTGMTVPKLNQEKLRSIPIPIPPIDEQHQLLSVLKKVSAGIDQAKANIQKNLNNTKELFQSELNAIFSERGEGWEEKRLGEVTTKIGSGATPRGGNASYKSEGVSLVRSMNVHDEGFNFKNLAFIDNEQARLLNNVVLGENDVLLNITGASVARCCVVPSEILPARVNQHVSIIRLKSDILRSKFVHFALTSKVNKDSLLGIGEQGSTRQAITKAQIEQYKISFPSLEVQDQIIARLEGFAVQTKKLQGNYQQKLQALEDLKKSILEKAFKGQLAGASKEMGII